MINKINGYVLGHGSVALGNKLATLENNEYIHSIRLSKLLNMKEIGSNIKQEETYETTLIGCDNIQGLNSLEEAFNNLKNHFYHSCYSGA